MRIVYGILCASAALAFGCDSAGGTGADVPAGGAVQVTSQKVSECGGFAAGADTIAAYCDAEVLSWTFDPATGSLTLVDSRVPLNCCGQHAMALEGSAGVYTATETDGLPENGMRCRCDCVYDFRVTGAPVAGASPISLALVRDVAGQDGYPKTIWSGTLDLSAGSGSVVIDTSPVPMGCAPP